MTCSRLQRVPKYKFHKSSGHAFVTLSGRNHFLGVHGTAASREMYDRLIAQWLTSGRPAPQPQRDESTDPKVMTAVELIAAYRSHVESIYPPATVWVIRSAMRPLKKLCGTIPAHDFTPRHLKMVQMAMAAPTTDDAGDTRNGLSRTTINDYTARIRGMFKWGVVEGLLPATVWHGLQAVAGLRRGRSAARETEPVGPVADSEVDAVLPHLPPMVADMVRLQRLTGARPGEICRMSAREINRSGPVWVYKPARHKTEHHGKDRLIAIGPKAQAILHSYLKASQDLPLFRPEESQRLRREKQRRERRSPMTPSQLARQERNRMRVGRHTGQPYPVASYRRAVARACLVANVAVWSPNQLRHSRATELRRIFGLDVAGAVLGHAKLETTQVYAARSLELATQAALATG